MILCQYSTDNVERLLVTGNGGNTATFDLFDSESGQDLTLSPQTFTSSTEAFINDNSDSLGVPGDTDTGRLFHGAWTCVDLSVPFALSTEYQVRRSYLMEGRLSAPATEVLSVTD
jgi:hypothetical protein